MADIITKIKNSSPTSKFLLEYFPEGSEVTRQIIAKLYETKSTGLYRRKRKIGKHNVKFTRRWRGVKLFNKMIKIGYWKEHA